MAGTLTACSAVTSQETCKEPITTVVTCKRCGNASAACIEHATEHYARGLMLCMVCGCNQFVIGLS